MSEIKERPVPFPAPMVRAILEGRKTVTRQAIKHQPDVPVTDAIPRRNFPHGPATIDWYWRPKHGHLNGVPSSGWDFKCPYGQPGDRLWVREAWTADAQVDAVAPRDLSQGEPIHYPADGDVRQTGCAMITPGKGRPSIHMPRWVSRILLEITDVRVERLQDISEAQCIAEGIHPVPKTHEHSHQFWRNYHLSGDGTFCVRTPKESFESLWCHVAGGSFPRGAAAYQVSPDSWDANPWVWVVEFKRVTP